VRWEDVLALLLLLLLLLDPREFNDGLDDDCEPPTLKARKAFSTAAIRSKYPGSGTAGSVFTMDRRVRA
jgi:hypothetical protein